MNAQVLIESETTLTTGDRGLLVMGESTTTCNKRFEPLGILPTAEMPTVPRHDRHDSAWDEAISGAVLFDEATGPGSRPHR